MCVLRCGTRKRNYVWRVGLCVAGTALLEATLTLLCGATAPPPLCCQIERRPFKVAMLVHEFCPCGHGAAGGSCPGGPWCHPLYRSPASMNGTTVQSMTSVPVLSLWVADMKISEIGVRNWQGWSKGCSVCLPEACGFCCRLMQSEDCRHYFLTHAHSDHTTGLGRSFCGGTIYCTPVTAAVLQVGGRCAQLASLGGTPYMLKVRLPSSLCGMPSVDAYCGTNTSAHEAGQLC